jgi:flagellar biosynthesis protein FliP
MEETMSATKRASWTGRAAALALAILVVAGVPSAARSAQADAAAPFGIHIQFDKAGAAQQYSQPVRILLLLTLLSIAPSALLMTTSFTRILIVFGFLRQALGTQNTPPGHVLSALALFLTVFIMMPVWQKINTDAVQPFLAEQISEKDAWARGVAPLRAFMARQTGKAELALFVELRKAPAPAANEEPPLEALVPAFMMSELKTAFQMGFLIYLPFLVIDLVISSSLMALGMFMLPPMMISLPAKVLFFVLADGWTLITRGLVSSFVT